jgi:hypothetical protein
MRLKIPFSLVHSSFGCFFVLKASKKPAGTTIDCSNLHQVANFIRTQFIRKGLVCAYLLGLIVTSHIPKKKPLNKSFCVIYSVCRCELY